MFVDITVSNVHYNQMSSHSPAPKLLIKLLTRKCPIQRLTVLIEHAVS